jgi:hypothetical protein
MLAVDMRREFAEKADPAGCGHLRACRDNHGPENGSSTGTWREGSPGVSTMRQNGSGDNMHDDFSFDNENYNPFTAGNGMAGGHSERHVSRNFTQAMKIRISFNADGTASVFIDNLRPFPVSPICGKLAEALAMDSGNKDAARDGDPLVPFKTVEELCAHMTAALNRNFTQAALKQAIYRLRRTLSSYGYGGLLQTNRKMRGYRLAVRRQQ